MPTPKQIGLGLALFTAAGIGAVAGATQHTVEYRTITIKSAPEVLTHVEEKEVVKTTPMPESCKSLIHAAQESFTYDKAISLAAGKINQAIFDGVTHLAMNEPTQWDDAEQAIYDAQQDLNRALVSKGELADRITTLQKQCNEAQKTQ